MKAEFMEVKVSPMAMYCKEISILTYSEKELAMPLEKAGTPKGGVLPCMKSCWNYGFPQEMAHFVGLC